MREVKRFFIALVLFPTLLLAHKKIVIEGSGDSEYLFAALASEFQRLHPGIIVRVPPSIHSGGGIRAVFKGKADLGRISRRLTPEEKKLGLKVWFFAITPVVFAVHPSVKGVDDLPLEKILDIYRGKTTNWKEVGGPDHKIYMVQREPGDSCRVALEKAFPAFKKLNSPAYTAYSTPEALTLIERHPYTIGYIPLAVATSGRVKVLSMGGVKPTKENVKKGLYKPYLILGVVYREKLSQEARLFLKFLSSRRARNLMEKLGAYPIDGE